MNTAISTWLRATPESDSLPITITEFISSDIQISHNFFVHRTEPPPLTVTSIQDYIRDSADVNLLSKPLSDLLREVTEIPVSGPGENRKENSGGNLMERFRAADNSIWADKYEATKFSHLVSEDYVNREALLWLKSWDIAVLGAQAKGGISTIANQRIENRKDVLLISGPSGSGKTTLAKVTALHCGYVPFLIDCTMESSAANLVQKVTNAMSIQSIHRGKKSDSEEWKTLPMCVVLDQVETLDKLEDLFKKPLKRPVIAIATDLFAPVLKTLKTHCLILQCKLGAPGRMQTRLMEICRNEGLKIETNSLLYLLTHSNNDIRSCLNGMQMMRINRPTNAFVSLEEVKTCIGKDLRHSAFEIWKQIFSKQDFPNITRFVLDSGDIELVNQGIYENYPFVDSADYELLHTSQLLDVLALDDLIDLRTKEKQQYELMTCQALPARVANHYFNSSLSEIHFPVLSRQYAKATTECMDTLRNVDLESLRRPCKSSFQTALEDVWPFVMSIINPGIGEGREGNNMSWEVFKELGFTIVNKTVEPAVHRIFRIPANVALGPNVIAFYQRLQDTPKSSLSKPAPESQGKEAKVAKRKRENGDDTAVWYQFHEGLTNAVKRKVRICDLLLR